MKVIILFNKKLSQWIISFNKIIIFTILVNIKKEKYYSFLFKNYFKILKLLRQFGLKKSLKNFKQY